MKKLMMTTLAVLASGVVCALPVDNASSASLYTNGICRKSNSCYDDCYAYTCWSWVDMFSFRIGFYGDYVFNRNLKLEHATNNVYVQQTELFTNAGYLVVNFRDWIDVFATVGATEITMNANSRMFIPVAGPVCTINFAPTFSWSVGARATAWQCGAFTVGVEGQYFRTQPDLTNIVVFGAGDAAPLYFNSNNQTHYDEWQVGLAASYMISTGCPGVSFVPYTAVKWAGGLFETNDFTTTVIAETFTIGKLEPGKLWGYAIGLTTVVNSAVGVTVEGRFADEKAVYVNGQFRF